MYTALRALILIVVVVHTSQSAGNDFDSLRTERRGDQMFVVHQVEQQETLFSLSQRYGATVDEIQEANDLAGNAIDIDQLIYVPIASDDNSASYASAAPDGGSGDEEGVHVVEPQETLYSISKKYDVSVEELKDWNGLPDNNLDIGQQLIVAEGVTVTMAKEPEDDTPQLITPIVPVGSGEASALPVLEKKPALAAEDDKKANDELEDDGPSYSHYVQAGETLRSISKKFNTSVDSLVAWNELSTDRLSIGQKLLIRKEVIRRDLVHRSSSFRKTKYGSKKWVEQNQIIEEGIAGVIDGDVGTTRYLALHRDLPVGSEIRVLNLMNHREIKVKVVGKLPETGLNRNVMVRLTSVTFKDLGIIDPKSRVELSYASAN